MPLTPNRNANPDNEASWGPAESGLTVAPAPPSAPVLPTAPAGVGRKFHADGRVRRFPGNTVICHLDPTTPIFAALTSVQSEFARLPYAAALAFLPPPSFHMTVFAGALLAGEEQEPGVHTGKGAVAHATHRRMLGQLHGIEASPRFRMRISNLGFRAGDVLACALEPADATENCNLRELRDLLSSRLRLREPDHDTYEFHISLAYLVRWLTQAELERQQATEAALLRPLMEQIHDFCIGPAEFCVFDDMHHFEPIFRLE